MYVLILVSNFNMIALPVETFDLCEQALNQLTEKGWSEDRMACIRLAEEKPKEEFAL